MPDAFKPETINAFLEKGGAPNDEAHRKILENFVAHLMTRGQYVEAGDLKKQFTETFPVKDKNGVSIQVDRCMVCDNRTYLVED